MKTLNEPNSIKIIKTELYRVQPNVLPKYLKLFPKDRNVARQLVNLHKSSSQLPRWFSAGHFHGFSTYSLASPIPPAVIANVASFSGISGLVKQTNKQKKKQETCGLNAVVEQSPKCCKCKQPGILQRLYTYVQTVKRDQYYEEWTM